MMQQWTAGDEITAAKLLQTGVYYMADAQASDAYVITPNPAIAAYVDGMMFAFKAATANTGNATLNVNGKGAKNILKNKTVTLSDNDIKAGQIMVVVYDSTQDAFQLVSPGSTASGDWQLLGETTAAGGSATLASPTIAAKARLWVFIDSTTSANGQIDMTFNADTGANYAYRRSYNGAADTTATAQSKIIIDDNIPSALRNVFCVFTINNASAKAKLLIGESRNGPDTGATPGRTEISAVWNNTSAQITSISLAATGGATFNSGSKISIYGAD